MDHVGAVVSIYFRNKLFKISSGVDVLVSDNFITLVLIILGIFSLRLGSYCGNKINYLNLNGRCGIIRNSIGQRLDI